VTTPGRRRTVASRQLLPREIWAREEAAARRRVLEDLFAHQVHALKLPIPEQEFRFHPDRMWRFDFAWPAFWIAVELDGGSRSGGRHVRGQGFENDAEKLNAAAALGWKVFRYTSTRVRSGWAVSEIQVMLERAAAAKRARAGA